MENFVPTAFESHKTCLFELLLSHGAHCDLNKIITTSYKS